MIKDRWICKVAQSPEITLPVTLYNLTHFHPGTYISSEEEEVGRQKQVGGMNRVAVNRAKIAPWMANP